MSWGQCRDGHALIAPDTCITCLVDALSGMVRWAHDGGLFDEQARAEATRVLVDHGIMEWADESKEWARFVEGEKS